MKKRLFVSVALLTGLIAFAGCGNTTAADGTTADGTATAEVNATTGDETKAEHIGITEMNADDYVVSIGDYKNMEVAVTKQKVTDSDIDETLSNLITSKAKEEPVEGRPLKSGDIANINYAGKMDGEAFEGGTDDSEDGYDLKIGSGAFVPGFEDALIGMNIGETRDIDLVFPENYYEQLAGKPVVFTVTLNGIKETVVPELTDEFVKNEGGVEGVTTVAELKDYVRTKLESEADSAYETAINNAIMTKLIEICEFKDELPEGRYQFYYDSRYESDEAMATDYGLQLEGYAMYVYGVQDMNGYIEKVKDYATKATKLDLAVVKILESENAQVTDDELNKEIEEKYASYGCASADEFKEKYDVEEYRAYIMNMRVIDIVKAGLKVVEAE